MKKAESISVVLGEMLDVLEAGQIPDAALIKRGRSSLSSRQRSIKRSQKLATAASAASGNSGRPAKYDREAIKAAEGSYQEIATRFGCSPTLVSILKKEAREEAKKTK